MSDERREKALEKWQASPAFMDGGRIACFRAGYDACAAENAERVRELEAKVWELEHRRIWCQACGETAQTSPYCEAVERAEAAQAQLAEARATIERLEHAHCIEGDYTGEDAPLALALVRLEQVVKQYSEQVRGLKTEVQQLEAGFIHYTERAEARISELESQLGHTGERADMVRGKPVNP